MSSGKTIPLELASGLATAWQNRLGAACERVASAGSVRRSRPRVGDVELVLIPFRQRDLLGEGGDSKLDHLLSQCVGNNLLYPPSKSGERYKRFELVTHPGVHLDLFIVAPETWPVLMAIRTGPADFSRMLVTQRAIGGFLHDGYAVREGRLWRCANATSRTLERAVELRTEEDFFRHTAIGWVPPAERDKMAEHYRKQYLRKRGGR